jgi:hypothetical protein
MSAKLIIVGVCVVLMSVSSASAKSWRGIEPLHSTRADVERLFGLPVDKVAGMWVYDFPEERAFISFSSGEPCEEGLPYGTKLPKDIVLSINTYPTIEKKIADVLTPGKEYEQIPSAHTPHINYVDSDEGIRFTASGDFLHSITYGATAKEKDYSCGEYKYAAPISPGVKLKKAELATLDKFGAISFNHAEARLDSFVINLFNFKDKDPSWRGYIIVMPVAGHIWVMRIPAHREHPFRAIVSSDSGRT